MNLYKLQSKQCKKYNQILVLNYQQNVDSFQTVKSPPWEKTNNPEQNRNIMVTPTNAMPLTASTSRRRTASEGYHLPEKLAKQFMHLDEEEIHGGKSLGYGKRTSITDPSTNIKRDKGLPRVIK